jgi:uncharacterized membrane protein
MCCGFIPIRIGFIILSVIVLVFSFIDLIKILELNNMASASKDSSASEGNESSVSSDSNDLLVAYYTHAIFRICSLVFLLLFLAAVFNERKLVMKEDTAKNRRLLV